MVGSMASPSEIGSPAPRAAGERSTPPPAGPAPRRGRVWPSLPTLSPRHGLLLLALVIVYLSHPLTWVGLGHDASARLGAPLWAPPAGLALVLVAWFGPRACAAVLGGCALLLLAQHALLDLWQTSFTLSAASAPLLAWVAFDAGLTFAEAGVAWWLFHTRGRGHRELADPHSTILFVLLVPGAVAALAAAFRLLAAHLLALPGLPPGGLFLQYAGYWLDRALGILVVAPPLLVTLTPWLDARRLVDPDADAAGQAPRASRGPRAEPRRLETARAAASCGDWVEVAGLAAAAGLICLVLSRLHGRELMGWQLWGVQTLLIVWASLRQGLRGGTIVAAAAAALPLVARRLWPAAPPGGEDPYFLPLLQAHLAAQCSVGLLVAAASSWARLQEVGYRQIVAHVPVVIYSARLVPARGAPPEPASPSGPTPDPGLGVGVAEVTLASAACTQLLGLPAEELVGDYSRWLARVHPEDRIVVLAALDQLARQDGPVTCEYRLAGPEEAPSGADESAPRREAAAPVAPSAALQPRWLRDTLAPHRDASGKLVGWEGVVTDITEQRRLADDLRRTTSMFHALVGNLPTGVFFIQGPHGQPVLVNARARQLLGTREDAAAGLEHLPRVYRLFKPDGTLYPAEELPVYQALKQGRTTMRDDIVVHRPDGRRTPLVTWAAPVVLGQRGTRTATACAVWVLEDLTALHQAEAARKDSESRLRAIIEGIAEGLFVHDARGIISHCNPAASAFFSQPAEQARGRTIFELGWDFVREDGSPLPREQHPCELVLRTGRPVRHVVLGMRRGQGGGEQSGSGLTRWAMVNAMPLGQGGCVTTFTDVGAYLQAREAIRVSEERYRGLVESLPLVLVQVDPNLRLTYANPILTTIAGYTLAEVAEPAAWASILHPEDVAPAQELSRSALAGRPARGEVRYRAKDGSEKVAYVFTQPRTQEGRVVGATALMLDVTRERRLEAELERARRLELIGRLSSGVAHDFNNLLCVVLNLTDLASGHLPEGHPVHADLRRIGEASEQAAGLAAQLLSFSRQKPQAPRRIDLNEVARRTLELLRATLPEGITLDAALAGDGAEVLADETQIQQVLMNLCLNARDAMPGGGTLRVTTACEPTGPWDLNAPKASDGAAKGWVRLSVADSGQGMSADLRGRIFEPFFSTKEGGTGLGLAVVQQIVESYGGRIEVHSEPNQGARFDIRWPRA